MKKLIVPTTLAIAAMVFLSGCVAAIGNGEPARSNSTLGQQLIDLQKAKEAGTLSDAEYNTQKAKLLGGK